MPNTTLRLVPLVLAALLLGGLEDAQGQAEVAEARRLMNRLRDAPAHDREVILKRLAELGDIARPVLKEALRDPDPDVRFYALFLLHEPDGRLERALRDVFRGRAGRQGAAPSYPEALQAYQRIIKSGTVDTRAMLIQLIRRKAGTRPVQVVPIAIALDLIRELTTRDLQRNQVDRRDAARLASLLDLELLSAFHNLVLAFGALPAELSLPALRSVLAGGSTWARIRAARVLAEVVPPRKAMAGLFAIQPLLSDKDPRVRLAAAQSLDMLLVPDTALVPVGRLALDTDDDVALEALRIAGERRLKFVREACEKVIRDQTRPLNLRKEAVRTLGLLGDPGAAAVLRRIISSSREPRELSILATWALGAIRAPGSHELLRSLILTADYSQEQILYDGLARAGGETAREALFGWIKMPSPMPANKTQVGTLRARARHALQAVALLEHRGTSKSLAELARTRPVRQNHQSGPTRKEIELALEALADRGDDESRRLIGEHVAGETVALDTALVALSRWGLPKNAEGLRGRVVTKLTGMLRTSRSTQPLAEAADALAKVDPKKARTLLTSILAGRSRWMQQSMNRHYARSLARAGDPSQIDKHALGHSRAEVRRATAPDQRIFLLNNVGIDLLYARRFDEAITVFRQMAWCKPEYELAAYNAACGYALQGQTENALRCLRRSIQLGYKDPRHMAPDSDLTSLRKDARFQRIVRRMHLAEETGLKLQKFLVPRERDPEKPR